MPRRVKKTSLCVCQGAWSRSDCWSSCSARLFCMLDCRENTHESHFILARGEGLASNSLDGPEQGDTWRLGSMPPRSNGFGPRLPVVLHDSFQQKKREGLATRHENRLVKPTLRRSRFSITGFLLGIAAFFLIASLHEGRIVRFSTGKQPHSAATPSDGHTSPLSLPNPFPRPG